MKIVKAIIKIIESAVKTATLEKLHEVIATQKKLGDSRLEAFSFFNYLLNCKSLPQLYFLIFWYFINSFKQFHNAHFNFLSREYLIQKERKMDSKDRQLKKISEMY